MRSLHINYYSAAYSHQWRRNTSLRWWRWRWRLPPSSLCFLDHCVSVTSICCSVPGVWWLVRLGIRCSQLMSEAGHPWPLWRPALASHQQQCGNRGCHSTLATTIYCVSRQWSTSCIVIWGTGLVHRWFISTLTTKKHDTYWLTLLFLFLVWVTLLFFWAPPSKFVCWKALRPGVSSPCQAWSSPRTFPRQVCDHLLTLLKKFHKRSLVILSLIYLAHCHSEVYSQ